MLTRTEAAKRLESHLRAAHQRSLAECLSRDDVDAAIDETLANNRLYQITESGVDYAESVTRSDARYMRPSFAMRKRIVA